MEKNKGCSWDGKQLIDFAADYFQSSIFAVMKALRVAFNLRQEINDCAFEVESLPDPRCPDPGFFPKVSLRLLSVLFPDVESIVAVPSFGWPLKANRDDYNASAGRSVFDHIWLGSADMSPYTGGLNYGQNSLFPNNLGSVRSVGKYAFYYNPSAIPDLNNSLDFMNLIFRPSGVWAALGILFFLIHILRLFPWGKNMNSRMRMVGFFVERILIRSQAVVWFGIAIVLSILGNFVYLVFTRKRPIKVPFSTAQELTEALKSGEFRAVTGHSIIYGNLLFPNAALQNTSLIYKSFGEAAKLNQPLYVKTLQDSFDILAKDTVKATPKHVVAVYESMIPQIESMYCGYSQITDPELNGGPITVFFREGFNVTISGIQRNVFNFEIDRQFKSTYPPRQCPDHTVHWYDQNIEYKNMEGIFIWLSIALGVCLLALAVEYLVGRIWRRTLLVRPFPTTETTF